MDAGVDAPALTRGALYDRVWAEPMRTLAARYGLSDVGLAKLCKRLEIPVPVRGHWQKVRAGKRVRRATLPAAPAWLMGLPDVVLEVRPAGPPPPPPAVAVEVQAAFEHAPEHQIVVPTVLPLTKALHPAVARFVAAKAKRAPLQADRPYEADIRVSSAVMDRALRIADALFKALEVRGYSVETRPPRPRMTWEGHLRPVTSWRSQWHRQATCIAVGDQDVLLILREAEERADKKHAARQPGTYGPYLIPSGRLTLFIPEYGDSWRDRMWADPRDGRGPRLEEQLNAVIVGVVASAEASRQGVARLRREVEERRQAAALHAERERLRAVEAARATEIERQTAAWTLATNIRAYVAAARVEGATVAPVGPGGLEGEAWLAWAAGHANRIDPLCSPRAPNDVLPTISVELSRGR
jgi:hypothetical protein